jgi:hypothetical protein
MPSEPAYQFSETRKIEERRETEKRTGGELCETIQFGSRGRASCFEDF